MIKVTDFCEIEPNDVGNTYGYFSIGCINPETSSNEDTWFYPSSYECKCSIDGDDFKIRLYKIGLSGVYLVLSDFSKILDYAVINSEDVLLHVRSSFEAELGRRYYKVADPFLTPTSLNVVPYITINDPTVWTTTDSDHSFTLNITPNESTSNKLSTSSSATYRRQE